jgi:hypothetical protein
MTGQNPPSPTPRDSRKPFCLEPLFGSYCRTASFALRGGPAQESNFVYFETFLDDPLQKTWSVHKVIISRKAEKTQVHTHLVCGKTSFLQSLETLAQFEKSAKADTAGYMPVVPDAAMLGYRHYRAFAEREGYVFDVQARPHARPDLHALPAEGTFGSADLQSSKKHLQRPAEEFRNDGPAGKAPATHFLFDHFNRAASVTGMDMEGNLRQMRILNVLDIYASQIKAAHENLSAYCAEYLDLGKGGLIDKAESALEKAGHALVQLRAYGVDVADFESFTQQCKITCHVLHAEGLYDLMNKGLGDFPQNEAAFKARVSQALDALKAIDSSENALRMMQDMIMQTPKPEVPASITRFITHYERQRDAFRRKTASSTRKPPQP